ncbi:unnamed protein product [Amoebophrya sp. A25]|nr:unnamed protein product [Amoebophrya sp. A25]|eukprot:GSA25T00001974001.1
MLSRRVLARWSWSLHSCFFVAGSAVILPIPWSAVDDEGEEAPYEGITMALTSFLRASDGDVDLRKGDYPSLFVEREPVQEGGGFVAIPGSPSCSARHESAVVNSAHWERSRPHAASMGERSWRQWTFAPTVCVNHLRMIDVFAHLLESFSPRTVKIAPKSLECPSAEDVAEWLRRNLVGTRSPQPLIVDKSHCRKRNAESDGEESGQRPAVAEMNEGSDPLEVDGSDESVKRRELECETLSRSAPRKDHHQEYDPVIGIVPSVILGQQTSAERLDRFVKVQQPASLLKDGSPNACSTAGAAETAAILATRAEVRSPSRRSSPRKAVAPGLLEVDMTCLAARDVTSGSTLFRSVDICFRDGGVVRASVHLDVDANADGPRLWTNLVEHDQDNSPLK